MVESGFMNNCKSVARGAGVSISSEETEGRMKAAVQAD